MSQIRRWIESTLAHFPERQDEIKPIEVALSACLQRIEALNAEVEKVTGKSEPTRIWRRRTKFKYIWSDDVMGDHLTKLRWEAQALHNLLTAISLYVILSSREICTILRVWGWDICVW
jgi:hypothetical protein